MVALRNMMPKDPSSRDFVETTFKSHPSMTSFVSRLHQYARGNLENPTITLAALAYDEWDPPLVIEITADIAKDDYIDRLHDIRTWAHSDSDFDGQLMYVSLLRRHTE